MAAALSFLAMLKEYRKFLTLLVVLVGAAAIYFWLEKAKDDRAQLLNAASRICDTAGEPFQPEGSEQADWGRSCLGRVTALKAFHEDARQGSLDAMLADLERREGKEAADAALAAAYARRANDALTRMEAADAAVANDHVGGDWAAAVNDLAGLR